MKEVIVGAVVSAILTGLIMLAVWLHKRGRRKKVYFETVWKHSSQLTPEDVMGPRGRRDNHFNDYYFPRGIEDQIEERIKSGHNVALVGQPLRGKSRTLFHVLTHLKTSASVTTLRLEDSYPTELEIPANTKATDCGIFVVDDIGKFIGRPGFMHILREFQKRKCIVIATCWPDEWEGAKSRLESEGGVIFSEPISVGDVTSAEGRKVAAATDQKLPKSFDGSIGSIFLPLAEMEKRYRECPSGQQAYLRSVKRQYQARIYSGREVFDTEKIHKVAGKFEELNLKRHEWKTLEDDLAAKGFVHAAKDGLHVEEAYLLNIVKGDFLDLADLEGLAELFADEPRALFSVAYASDDRALVDLKKRDYLKLAIKCLTGVLERVTVDSDREFWAMTQNNLGNAYGTLGEVEDKAPNCRLAIEAYKEALRVRNYEAFPMQYAMTQNNLGDAYQSLGDVEDKAPNCRLAIEAYKEALRVRTYEAFPMQYAMTQNNLGIAYQSLGEVEDKAPNCRLAIEAYGEALRVYTYEAFPMQYATIRNNLGNAYQRLGDVEDKAPNCRLAIEAYKEALRVRNYEAFPMDYAMTQNNLGLAYQSLGDVEDKAPNCRLAIEAYREALRVRTYEAFPMDYAMTQNNLGLAYWTFAEAEDKAGNCAKACKALEEALRVYREQKMPMQVEMVLGNLERLAAFCEGGENSSLRSE
jgi:tetratricopeptide (TPR) repeat protein